MPDEAQPLTAAKPEPTSKAAAKPARSAKDAPHGPVEHAQSAPVGPCAVGAAVPGLRSGEGRRRRSRGRRSDRAVR
ncbi:hypothetical protein ACWEQH_31855, partial [Streptomyces sp. NPDC004166]